MAEKPELRLSPSETMGIGAAQKIAGTQQGRGSTQKALASIALGFEIIVIFLTGLAMYGLHVFNPPQIGIYAGIGLSLVCVVALALMRTKIGIPLGWIVQVVLFAASFLLPATIAVALMFGGLWVYCMVKGAKVDRLRAQWAADPDSFQSQS